MSAGDDIVREVRIDAPPDVVFPFFTEPDKMIVWKAVEATLDPRLDPPRRVVFTFGWDSQNSPEPPGSTTVEITLVPDGRGTLLRLVHSGIPDGIRAGSDEGWRHYLQRLVIAAEGGEPGPDPWATQQPNANDERSA